MDEQSNERQAADLAAIKAREQIVKDAIRRGEPSVDLSDRGWTFQQLGLLNVMADEYGRLWRMDPGKMTLLSGPRRALR